MSVEQQNKVAQTALQLLGERCPRLAKVCYWAGTAAIASEELHHRQSFDLDFHTQQALYNVRPILAEILKAFPGDFEVVQPPDEFGSGFQGVLALPDGNRITIEVRANYEDVADAELVPARTSPNMRRISLSRYLADKIQCVVERVEARDLVDITAVLRDRPLMEATARQLVAEQDAVLLAERLLGWTDEEIENDLQAYKDVSTTDARSARDLILQWLRLDASRNEGQ